jgi:hypothetical protein
MTAGVASLAFAGHNNLRFKIVCGSGLGGAQTIISNAQLLAAVQAGPLRAIVRAAIDGLGLFPPATPLTQADSRAILCADDFGANAGNNKAPRAALIVTGRGAGDWDVDANVDGGGNPTIVVNKGAATGGEIGYVDVEFIGGIGA